MSVKFVSTCRLSNACIKSISYIKDLTRVYVRFYDNTFWCTIRLSDFRIGNLVNLTCEVYSVNDSNYQYWITCIEPVDIRESKKNR